MDVISLTEKLKRLLGASACFAIAAYLIFKGLTSTNPIDSQMIVPVMCSFTAVVLLATGITLALQTDPQPE